LLRTGAVDDALVVEEIVAEGPGLVVCEGDVRVDGDGELDVKENGLEVAIPLVDDDAAFEADPVPNSFEPDDAETLKVLDPTPTEPEGDDVPMLEPLVVGILKDSTPLETSTLDVWAARLVL